MAKEQRAKWQMKKREAVERPFGRSTVRGACPGVCLVTARWMNACGGEWGAR